MQLTRAELEEWQAALRDPKRKQVMGYLQGSQGQCCLGVFCELHASKLGLEVAEMESGRFSYAEERLRLPGRVVYRFNTNKDGPIISWEHLTSPEQDAIEFKATVNTPTGPGVYVSTLNDHGVSFERIAELLPHGIILID